MLRKFYFSLLALFATITTLAASDSNSETGTVPASCDLGDVTTIDPPHTWSGWTFQDMLNFLSDTSKPQLTKLETENWMSSMEGHLPFYTNFNKFRAINLAKTIVLLSQYIDLHKIDIDQGKLSFFLNTWETSATRYITEFSDKNLETIIKAYTHSDWNIPKVFYNAKDNMQAFDLTIQKARELQYTRHLNYPVDDINRIMRECNRIPDNSNAEQVQNAYELAIRAEHIVNTYVPTPNAEVMVRILCIHMHLKLMNFLDINLLQAEYNYAYDKILEAKKDVNSESERNYLDRIIYLYNKQRPKPIVKITEATEQTKREISPPKAEQKKEDEKRAKTEAAAKKQADRQANKEKQRREVEERRQAAELTKEPKNSANNKEKSTPNTANAQKQSSSKKSGAGQTNAQKQSSSKKSGAPGKNKTANNSRTIPHNVDSEDDILNKAMAQAEKAVEMQQAKNTETKRAQIERAVKEKLKEAEDLRNTRHTLDERAQPLIKKGATAPQNALNIYNILNKTFEQNPEQGFSALSSFTNSGNALDMGADKIRTFNQDDSVSTLDCKINIAHNLLMFNYAPDVASAFINQIDYKADIKEDSTKIAFLDIITSIYEKNEQYPVGYDMFTHFINTSNTTLQKVLLKLLYVFTNKQNDIDRIQQLFRLFLEHEKYQDFHTELLKNYIQHQVNNGALKACCITETEGQSTETKPQTEHDSKAAETKETNTAMQVYQDLYGLEDDISMLNQYIKKNKNEIFSAIGHFQKTNKPSKAINMLLILSGADLYLEKVVPIVHSLKDIEGEGEQGMLIEVLLNLVSRQLNFGTAKHVAEKLLRDDCTYLNDTTTHTSFTALVAKLATNGYALDTAIKVINRLENSKEPSVQINLMISLLHLIRYQRAPENIVSIIKRFDGKVTEKAQATLENIKYFIGMH